MILDQSLALGSVKTEDGSVVIRGWIKAPVSSKVMVRFETLGTEVDSVEGLYWASVGGWYKYLPATGKPEYFEIATTFDIYKHGVPKLWVERWSGVGEIDVVVDGYTGPDKLLLWASAAGQEKLKSSLAFPTECFGINSGLITSGSVRSSFAIQKLQESRNKDSKDEATVADISKSTLKSLHTANFDALVIDIESMLKPIANVEDSYIEDSTEARILGAIPLGSRVLTPNESSYWGVLLQSFESVVVASRPRPVIALLPNTNSSGSSELHQQMVEEHNGSINEYVLSWDELANKLLEIGVEVVRLNNDKSISVEGLSEIGEILRKGKVVDSLMSVLPSVFPKTELATSYEIQKGEPQILEGLGLSGEFIVETDIQVPVGYPERNLILVLELEPNAATPDTTALRKAEVYRSSLLGVEYFKYIETGEGYRHYQIPVTLPELVTCSGIGFAQVREKQEVNVRNVAIRAESSVWQESER